MGSNFCKNLTYDECRLTRYDAHCGVYNATITNSEVGHIALIGGGVARIENSTVYVGAASYPVVNLRSDYGSTWDGDMIFKNVHVVISNPNIKTFAMVGGSHVSHYFGYQTYLPENIEIDNITCNNAGATVKVFSDTLCGYTDAQRNDKTNPYITTKSVVIRNNHANLTYSYPDAGHTFFSDLQVTEE
jgi:hypothetical protein